MGDRFKYEYEHEDLDERASGMEPSKFQDPSSIAIDGLFLDLLGCQARQFPHMLPSPAGEGARGEEGAPTREPPD